MDENKREAVKPASFREPPAYISVERETKLSDCCNKAVYERRAAKAHNGKGQVTKTETIFTCSQCHCKCTFHTIKLKSAERLTDENRDRP